MAFALILGSRQDVSVPNPVVSASSSSSSRQQRHPSFTIFPDPLSLSRFEKKSTPCSPSPFFSPRPSISRRRPKMETPTILLLALSHLHLAAAQSLASSAAGSGPSWSVSAVTPSGTGINGGVAMCGQGFTYCGYILRDHQS